MKTRIFHTELEFEDANGDSRVITVVGLYKQKKVMLTKRSTADVKLANGKEGVNAEIVYDIPKNQRTLSLGYSICHPLDCNDYDKQTGISIALSRAKNNPIGTLQSFDVTMLNEDSCMVLIENEARHIAKHIEKYINF